MKDMECGCPENQGTQRKSILQTIRSGAEKERKKFKTALLSRKERKTDLGAGLDGYEMANVILDAE